MKVGDTVKYSDTACRSLRDNYLNQGEYSRRSMAKKWYDDKRAKRGILVAIEQGTCAVGYKVKWDDGMESTSLSYMLELA